MEHFINNIEVYLHGSVVMSFVAAFCGGLLASFTPCVYPMIPITAGVVGDRNLGGSRIKGFVLSLTYVMGVALTYSILGVFAATTGRMFGEINTNPYAFFFIANIMIVLGLGMLDVFNIPTFSFKNSPKLGGTFGVFVLGMASGLVAGPCTAPVLGALLAYVAAEQSVFLGGSLLFVFAIGMSVILVLVGTFSGIMAALPKSGEWMVKIKKALGILMIVLGEYFLVKAGQLIL